MFTLSKRLPLTLSTMVFQLTLMCLPSAALPRVAQADGGSSSLGPGVPLEFYCRLWGGSYHTATTSDRGGETFCQLGSSVFGAWDVLRGGLGRLETSVDHFLEPGRFGDELANPALFCRQQTGTVVTATFASPIGTIQLCRFRDRTVIDVNSLARGPDATESSAAAALFRRRIARHYKMLREPKLERAQSIEVGARLARLKVPMTFDRTHIEIPQMTCRQVAGPGTPSTCSVSIGTLGAPIQVTGDDALALFDAFKKTPAWHAAGAPGSDQVEVFDLACPVMDTILDIRQCVFSTVP